ncbi:MAG: hypothetical protein AB9834_14190 [Lentimicrobium sp.]
MKYLKRPIGLLFATFLILISCNSKEKRPGNSTSPDADQTKPAFVIHRYEKALFSIPPENLAEGLKKIAPEYKVFLGDHYTSPEAIARLREFMENRQNKEVYAECLKRFPDLNGLAVEFNNAFNRLKTELPEFKDPEIFTYVSGFDFQYPIKYTESDLVVALDMYLGSDYPGYRKMGIPLYISERLTPVHILPDCMKEMAMPYISGTKTPVLLDAMIEEGKILYFADLMLPETDDYLIAGFSASQMAWCKENESKLWEFLIENELLYSSNAEPMSMFMTDGPFTASFSQESPSRTGAWLGWQIVKKFAEKTKTGIKELMANANSQEILEKSGYKPTKN